MPLPWLATVLWLLTHIATTLLQCCRRFHWCCWCPCSGLCSQLLWDGVSWVNTLKEYQCCGYQIATLEGKAVETTTGSGKSCKQLCALSCPLVSSTSKNKQMCVPSIPEAISDLITTGEDYKLNYATVVLRMGMLARNFHDASREGDGQWLIRCWKFVLLHF